MEREDFGWSGDERFLGLCAEDWLDNVDERFLGLPTEDWLHAEVQFSNEELDQMQEEWNDETHSPEAFGWIGTIDGTHPENDYLDCVFEE